MKLAVCLSSDAVLDVLNRVDPNGDAREAFLGVDCTGVATCPLVYLFFYLGEFCDAASHLAGPANDPRLVIPAARAMAYHIFRVFKWNQSQYVRLVDRNGRQFPVSDGRKTAQWLRDMTDEVTARLLQAGGQSTFPLTCEDALSVALGTRNAASQLPDGWIPVVVKGSHVGRGPHAVVRL